LNLVGRIESARSRIQIQFRGLPDLPLSNLEVALKGGPGGLLVASGGSCPAAMRARAALEAQNGRLHRLKAFPSGRCPDQRTGESRERSRTAMGRMST
jgi:hypothetical protein